MSKKVYTIYIAIILVLVGTNTWWIYYSYNHNNAAEHFIQHVKDYPLLDPALPLYEKNNLIVNIQELREYLKALPEQNKNWAEISIYFEVLNTGANVTVNSDLKIWPASLTKLPIAMIAMKKVEKGEWSLDKKTTVLHEDLADLEDSPGLIELEGQSYDLAFILERLLLESDNTAFMMLHRQFTEDELSSINEEVGLDELFAADSKVSAKDYTRLLRSLYSATYLNKSNSQMILKLLDQSKFDEFVSAGFPDDLPFSHKWGENRDQNVYVDSGIVYVENRPFIISVMIHSKNTDIVASKRKAIALMKDIGERSYQFMNSK